MPTPRSDTGGIVGAPELFTRVHFRRREPAEPLRPYVEHYWLIDWDLSEPFVSHVVPHPSVNIVFQRYVFQRYGQTSGQASGQTSGQASGQAAEDFGEVAGIGLELSAQRLEGRGRVCGIQFRPGGFRPFLPGRPVSELTGRRTPLLEVFAGHAATPPAVLGPPEEDARVAALDQFLAALGPAPDPRADEAMALADLIRRDRSIRRVDEVAETAGTSVRSLQRLFAAYVGVSPKWVILRYRIHEALERAAARSGTGAAPDWAGLAAELGYSDQAHLVRDFTARVGVPPTAYGAGADIGTKATTGTGTASSSTSP